MLSARKTCKGFLFWVLLIKSGSSNANGKRRFILKTGFIHIYCGDGKGKTTAAIGLAVRAAGAGYRVLIARFLKNDHSAELASLDLIPGIDVLPAEKEFGFIFSKDNPVLAEAREYYSGYFELAIQKAVEDHYDMLILDEINAAVTYGVVQKDRLTAFLTDKPQNLEVILTGRDPAEEVIALADYVSEIQCCAHPFEKGIRARKGIEY